MKEHNAVLIKDFAIVCRHYPIVKSQVNLNQELDGSFTFTCFNCHREENIYLGLRGIRKPTKAEHLKLTLLDKMN